MKHSQHNPFSRSPRTGADAPESAGNTKSAVRRAPRTLAALGVGATLLAAGLVAAGPASAATNPGILSQIKACESGGSYTAVNASSGASGAYQFLNSTWRSLPAAAGYSTAASAPAAVQDQAARQLFAQQGTSPWLASAGCWRHGGGATTASSNSLPRHQASAHHKWAGAAHHKWAAAGQHQDSEAADRNDTGTVEHHDFEHGNFDHVVNHGVED